MSLVDAVVNSGVLRRSDCVLAGNSRAISGRHASQSGSRARTWNRSSLAASVCCGYVQVSEGGREEK